jgi:ribosome-binding factor A
LRAEVEEIISLALLDAGDDRLRQLSVHSVQSRGDGAYLSINLIAPGPVNTCDLDGLYEALEHARGWLRQQVAEEVHRKRVPELMLVVLPPWEVEA